ncbi:MAG: GcvT family protein [Hyphomicrobiales bacterium]|nr:GcvT family protein [Hyphomicrobiales bacterium]MCP5373826.1 GcvT family protein [Hyphomicrobiales bacterium]
MPGHAQVVVIGGGVVGCSILYHLAKLGWTDVVLLERAELTAGSSWHAAGGIHGLHDSNNISRQQYYTLRLYAELEAETGQSCGVHRPGILYLAQTADREHQLRIQSAKARAFGVSFDEVSREQAAAMNPLLNLDGIRCVMYEPDSGWVDPAGVTHAYAIAARKLGARIHRFTPVVETNPRPDGGWDVVTPRGTIHAETVVNAAGLWAREVARLAGFDLPLVPTEHQYFVTETVPEIAALGRDLPSVADRDGEYYLRQEGQGLLVGAYERDPRFWSRDGTPLDFGQELFPDDLDRISENVLRACERVPVLASAGIKSVINGPMIWSPDSAALLGPVPELRNYYCCCGIIPGFSQSGGLGLTLAQWIVEGEPELDMFPWDMARYGAWANRDFTEARVMDCYAHRFAIHFPLEERAAGRPVRTRPVYRRQQRHGAVFGLTYGWEYPLWYAGPDATAEDSFGFERQPWWGPVGDECRALRAGAGVLDTSHFAKYEVAGPGAADWLDRIVANRVPRQVGRTCLAPMLGARGGIAGDFTVSLLAQDRYLVVGSGLAERYHARHFAQVARPAGVTFRSLTDAWAGFNVAGPQSRELLSRLTDADVGNDAFPFLRARPMAVAGLDAVVIRVSFTGDLGYEIYVAEADQAALFDALFVAGEDLGVRPVGARALASLRIEKGYGSWGREYSPEYWPQEVGLDRLVKLDKPDFLGRDAYLALKDRPPRERLCILALDATGADAWGGEPVFLPGTGGDWGRPVGRVTSGAYGHTVETSLALGFIAADVAAPGLEVEVAILGRPHRARVLAQPPFDPDGARLRG